MSRKKTAKAKAPKKTAAEEAAPTEGAAPAEAAGPRITEDGRRMVRVKNLHPTSRVNGIAPGEVGEVDERILTPMPHELERVE